MSLKDIISALEDEAQTQRDEILARAKKQAEQIVNEAKAQAKLVEQEQRRRLEDTAKTEEARLMHQANFDKQSALVATRESLVSEAVGSARDKLIAFSQTPAYEPLFKALVAEAWESASSLDGDRIVMVNARDKQLATKTLDEMSLRAQVVDGDFEGGGLVIASGNRRQRLVNTLVGRLARAEPLLTPQVTRILFADD